MKSIAYIPGSDQAGTASLMTVTNGRSAGATTIQVNTVANAPTKFYASMGTPHDFTDPVTGETITIISEATAVDFAGHIDGTNVEIDEIAPGYTDGGSEVGDIIIIRPITEWANNIANVLGESHDDDGKLKAAAPVEDAFDFTTELLSGWINDPNTWTYVSGTGTITGVFKITGVDATGYLEPGMRVKLTQTQVKYGIITKVAFSTDTTVTLLMSATDGTVDNSGLTNATITSPAVSRVKKPFGFPTDPSRWTITLINDASNHVMSPVSTTFQSAGMSGSAPIGAWRVLFKAGIGIDQSATSTRFCNVTVSSDGSTETDPISTHSQRGDPSTTAASSIGSVHITQYNLVLTTVKTLTILQKVSSTTSVNSAGVVSGDHGVNTILQLTCAYL